MRRSAVARPSSAGTCGLSTTPGGVPNASTATSAAPVCCSPTGPAASSTTAIHPPAHWKLPGSAIGTRPDPCSASQVRQAPRACARARSGSGRSVTGTSVTDARHAANPRTSAFSAGPGGSSTSITGSSWRSSRGLPDLSAEATDTPGQTAPPLFATRRRVRFQYEWHDAGGQWFRSYGNELWEFDGRGRMRRREASINDVPIAETDRRWHGPRADDERGPGHDIPLR